MGLLVISSGWWIESIRWSYHPLALRRQSRSRFLLTFIAAHGAMRVKLVTLILIIKIQVNDLAARSHPPGCYSCEIIPTPLPLDKISRSFAVRACDIFRENRHRGAVFRVLEILGVRSTLLCVRIVSNPVRIDPPEKPNFVRNSSGIILRWHLPDETLSEKLP